MPLVRVEVAVINAETLEVFVSTHYEDIKIDIKCGKMGGLGRLRSLEIAPIR